MSDVMSVRLWLSGVRVLGVPVRRSGAVGGGGGIVPGLVAVPAVRVQAPSGIGAGGSREFATWR